MSPEGLGLGSPEPSAGPHRVGPGRSAAPGRGARGGIVRVAVPGSEPLGHQRFGHRARLTQCTTPSALNGGAPGAPPPPSGSRHPPRRRTHAEPRFECSAVPAEPRRHRVGHGGGGPHALGRVAQATAAGGGGVLHRPGARGRRGLRLRLGGETQEFEYALIGFLVRLQGGSPTWLHAQGARFRRLDRIEAMQRDIQMRLDH